MLNAKVKEKIILKEGKEKEDKDIINLRYLSIDDFDLLIDLLKIESVSEDEGKAAKYVKERLLSLGFNVKKDHFGNMYAVRGESDNYALINAHMDIVNLMGKVKNSYFSQNYVNSKKSNSALDTNIYNDSFNYYNIPKSSKNETATKEVELTIQDALSIWDSYENERKYHSFLEYKEIGYGCGSCVNNCKKYKICAYFEPKEDDKSTILKFGEFKTKKSLTLKDSESDDYKISNFLNTLSDDEVEKDLALLANDYNYSKEYLGYEQQSLDLEFDLERRIEKRKFDSIIKSSNEKIEAKAKSRNNSYKTKIKEEKYIIKADLINDKISGSGKRRVLGGDDKCGIFVALKIAEMLPDMPLKILFTVQEEIGCLGIKHFAKTKSNWFKDVRYSLTIDRRGSDNLLWSQRGTRSCDNNFAAELMYQGIKIGIPVSLQDGGSADVVTIRDYVPNSVNMSAGYYKAHTQDEYIVPSELDMIVGWVKNIIENV